MGGVRVSVLRVWGFSNVARRQPRRVNPLPWKAPPEMLRLLLMLMRLFNLKDRTVEDATDDSFVISSTPRPGMVVALGPYRRRKNHAQHHRIAARLHP